MVSKQTMIFSEGIKGFRIFFFGSKKRALLLIWLLIALYYWIILGEKSFKFSALGAIVSGFSTFLFWNYRKQISAAINKIAISPLKKFVLIGSLAAVWVEFEFWVVGEIFNARIAANPNIFMDLLATMPWYVVMVFLLWKVEKKYSYSIYIILLFGGIYDFFTDGVIGTILNAGTFPLYLLPFIITSFPIFVLCYSFIVLPPTYLLRDEINRGVIQQKNTINKYLYGLLPLLGLFIFGGVMILLLSSFK